MSFTKTYFLCPTSDFIPPPPAGPLCLGSIIRSTSTPQFPLNRANVVPVTNADPPLVETDWKKTASTETALGLGVYAQFLRQVTGGLPFGADLDVEQSTRTTSLFEFDTVTTLIFEPTPQYVEEAVKAPSVEAYLKEPKQRFAPVSSLFLVTGIKLVKGASIRYSTSKNKAVSGNVGIDVALAGVTVGPKGQWTRINDDETEFNRASEFVFAFRLKKLRFGRKLKIEEYNKGAFMAVGKDGKDGETDSVLVDDVDFSTVENAVLVPDVAENGNVYCVPA